MFDHLLLPLDRSTLAECTLPHAVAIAQAFNSHVAFLHVLTPPPKLDRLRSVDPLEWRIRRAEAETYLQSHSEHFQSMDIPVEMQVDEGDAAEQIVKMAREQATDLIILSSHGQSGLSGWNVSSVTEKVIARAYTSVMIVRAYQPFEAELGALRYRRILVPLDGSQRAESVLPLASSLAHAHDAHILLAHVVHRPEMPRRMPLSQEDTHITEQAVERNQHEAIDYLADVCNRLQAPGAETRLIVSDRVASSLHQIAEQEDVDLVLLSAHGFVGETRWPYGGVATSFVAYGVTPLLILQDITRDQIIPSRAEMAALNHGRR